MDPNHRLFDVLPPARRVWAIPDLALASVTSKDRMAVYASSDSLYRGAIFGRDSLEVAEDLLTVKPKLVHNILLTLGRLQGTKENGANEEEPGKIIHEYRNTNIDGEQIRGKQLEIFEQLSAKWGGNNQELAYYGSIDATPQFLRTLGMYCLQHGDAILDETVLQRNGETKTMREVAHAAVSWLTGKLAVSKSGLVEYRRINPRGISNQVWKDSEEFYVHENGQLANHDSPIASIEVQGLAYDGLLAAATFFPAKATFYTQAAEKLRDRTLELLWQEDRRYFALGIDFDNDDKLRVIETKTANPASLLDTAFFDGLQPGESERYISAIIRTMMSPDFLTNAGIRSRALSAGHLFKEWDYHGSFVTWPKETYDIAKGFRRQGFPLLARQLENRLLNLVIKNHEYPEFVYVDDWGQVLGGAPVIRKHGNARSVPGINKPERIQAWTVSAIMAIVNRRLKEKFSRTRKGSAQTWQTEYEKYILQRIPLVDRYLNPLTLRGRYPTFKYRLDNKG